MTQLGFMIHGETPSNKAFLKTKKKMVWKETKDVRRLYLSFQMSVNSLYNFTKEDVQLAWR
jgi:hypothetical protein